MKLLKSITIKNEGRIKKNNNHMIKERFVKHKIK